MFVKKLLWAMVQQKVPSYWACQERKHLVDIALFPGLPRFLFLSLRSVYTRKRKNAKNVEGLGTPIM